MKNVPNLHVNVSIELLINKLYNHAGYNLISMDEVVSSFDDLFREIRRKKIKPEYMDCNIFNETDISILKNLKKNKDLIICKPDKGRGIVLMDRNNYVDKMNVILNDYKNFEKLHFVQFPKHILNLEDKANRIIKKLKDGNNISENEYKSLYVVGSGPGVIYGLPKIHKQNTPMRPVVSSINTPFYKLAKFLIPAIETFTRNEFTLNNSFEFFDKIRNMNLENKFIVSMDIVSLYTNIPVKETINIATELIYENGNFRNLSKNEFRKLLDSITSNTFFIFNSMYYKQLDGLAMGSPLSAALANVFLCFHEKTWIDECPIDFKPHFYQRYMDDTFMVFENEDQANKFLSYLNSKHPKIKFTLETENEKKLPFLDLLVDKSNMELNISIYRKPTNTSLGVNFLSACFMKYKLNTLNTMFFRAYKLTSSYMNFHNEITFLEGFFRTNGFHPNLFFKELRRFLSNTLQYNPPKFGPKKMDIYIKFPYLSNNLNKWIKWKMNQIFNKYYPQLKPCLVFYNNYKIKNFCNHKDRLDPKNTSMVVYKFTCPSCQLVYVGSTIKTLEQRVFEHLGTSYRTGRALLKPVQSSIRLHCHSTCKCNFNTTNFEILYKGNYQDEIRIAESLLIKQLKPTLNAESSSIPLRLH